MGPNCALNAIATAGLPSNLSRHLLSAFLLVVSTLHLLQLPCYTLDFILVLVHLRLIHIQLRCHGLHLVGFFFEVLLVYTKLLSYFGAWLACKQVL